MMRARVGSLLSLVLCLAAIGGCTDQRRYYFVGRVYDGLTGARLTDYKVELRYLDETIQGQVDQTGRYLVGPLAPLNDYTIMIEKAGFRSFLSHNAMQPDATAADESFYYDAYLFPVGVPTPPATFNVTIADSETLPSGSIRMRPISRSDLYDDAAETPAGVGTQVWLNDEDLQFATIHKEFSDGVVQFDEGELILGVQYLVTVYNVRGHQEVNATYRAGTDGNLTLIVPPLDQPVLEIAFVSTELGVPVPSGSAVIAFNQPVQFDPLNTDAFYRAVLDGGFSIDSPNANMNAQSNTLRAAGLRGIGVAIDGNRLTLSWDPASALQTTDAADPILSVTYGALDMVRVRPVNGPRSSSSTIAALLGSTSLTVTVTAP